jgi:two-component system response regulator ResD
MPKTIIIIDDDADTRTYLSTILLRGGYKVLTAGDGQEGWNLIQEHTPDLILLDMMMPRKSGLNLLNEVKTNPQFSLYSGDCGQRNRADDRRGHAALPG